MQCCNPHANLIQGNDTALFTTSNSKFDKFPYNILSRIIDGLAIYVNGRFQRPDYKLLNLILSCKTVTALRQ